MDPIKPTPIEAVPTTLHQQGWAVVEADALQHWLHTDSASLAPIRDSWSDLPPDNFLRDGGRYRFRRHSSFIVDPAAGTTTQVPHRPHWQPVTYNALHGGIERHFEPVRPEVSQHPLWLALITQLGQLLAQVKPADRWYVEAHQFRVDTAGGIGRPTPEGAHRDGVDFVAVIMLGRHQIKGGETRVFEADGPRGVRFTLHQPWSVLLIADDQVIHESTPIQPLDGHGWRDTLVLTFRANGFQDPIKAN
ncbi:2OG-Fe dioxygenase family protein [Aquabacterium sp.]|uniref:2OG-Fe dioxygenase family protein n=1 Tax=Aquabacterium sp. TaxID=1872578 RepID=UPI0035B1F747